jgi:crossover junction endodeoxyribonuclease RusA
VRLLRGGGGLRLLADRQLAGVICITLPWPPKELSPNARLHWAAKNRHRKTYRDACYWLSMQEGVRPNVVYPEPLDVAIEFVPPDKRARDQDNMLASIKAGLDGVAQAIGVDDKHWRLSMKVADRIGGVVKLTITQPKGTT